jgi:predicted aminopeptidase
MQTKLPPPDRVATLPRSRARCRQAALALLAFASLPLSGCYYAHLAQGQARILLARQSIADVLAANGTPPELAERLRIAGAVRSYAEELGLDVGAQYTSYVDWPGDRVVTSVVATRPGEIEARGFWFPLIGRVPYKGFFDRARAEREAKHLAGEGLDTCLVPVVAYSTLGWMADPLTAPLARSPRLAETLIHELVHATVFVASQPDFNEGVATFVGQEGVVRFVAARSGEAAAGRERLRVAEDRKIAAVLESFRREVADLYATTEPGQGRAARRAALELAVREVLAALPLATRDAAAVSRSVRLNDACQALIGTYQGDLPHYEALLERLGGDLARFVELARTAAGEPDPRAALLAPGG